MFLCTFHAVVNDVGRVFTISDASIWYTSIRGSVMIGLIVICPTALILSHLRYHRHSFFLISSTFHQDRYCSTVSSMLRWSFIGKHRLQNRLWSPLHFYFIVREVFVSTFQHLVIFMIVTIICSLCCFCQSDLIHPVVSIAMGPFGPTFSLHTVQTYCRCVPSYAKLAFVWIYNVFTFDLKAFITGIAQMLDISRTSVKRYVVELKEKGRFVKEGGNRLGRWIVKWT